MSLRISGIKCDKCHYRDDDVTFEQYSEYLNKPCPFCGTNLLTDKEYNLCLRLYRFSDIIDGIDKYMKWLNPAHYIKLIFGKKSEPESTITFNFPKRKLKK